MTVPAAACGPLLLPIGHLLGASYPQLGSTEHSVLLRVGPETVTLDDEQFTAWGLAHGLPGRTADEPWTRRELEATATQRGLGRLGPAIDALLADRVLVEVAPSGAEAVEFARQHRMLPLVLGLGNSAAEPEVWQVGLLGQPLAAMTSWVFDLFEWAHLDTDLWTACQAAARTALLVGRDELRATDPHALLDSLLQNLHQLLTVDAVCLDTRLATR